MMTKKYDYVIVGAGACGSLVAYALANKCPDTCILLIEMGDNNNELEIVADAGMMEYALANPDVSEKKTVSNDPTIFNLPKNISQGRGLGGSTCSSYMIAMKPSTNYICSMENILGMTPNISMEIMNILEKYISCCPTKQKCGGSNNVQHRDAPCGSNGSNCCAPCGRNGSNGCNGCTPCGSNGCASCGTDCCPPCGSNGSNSCAPCGSNGCNSCAPCGSNGCVPCGSNGSNSCAPCGSNGCVPCGPSRGECGLTTITQLPTGLTTFSLDTTGCNPAPPSLSTANDFENPLSLIRLLANAVKADYKTNNNNDYNACPIPNNFAVNKIQAFIENDPCGYMIRQQTGSSYLNECNVKKLKNLKIIKCSKVTKINMVKDKHHCDCCCGTNNIYKPKSLDIYVKGLCYKIYVKKGVILSAGFLSSPALLQASGIGPEEVLCSLEIPLLISNDNVGSNLQIQTGFYLDYWIKSRNNTSNAAKTESAVSILTASLDSFFHSRTNPFYSPARSSVIYSEPLGEITMENPPNLSCSSDLLCKPNPCNSQTSSTSTNNYYGVRLNVINVLPKTINQGGKGNICIVSKDGFTQPFIDNKAYTFDGSKLEVINYYKKLTEVIKAYILSYNIQNSNDPLDLFFPDGDPDNFENVQIFSVIAKNTTKTIGGCTNKVGNNVCDSVIDNNFLVHGTCGLYVADASVLPFLPDCLPQWYIMMLGYYFGCLLGDICSKQSCRHCEIYKCKNKYVCKCKRCRNDSESKSESKGSGSYESESCKSESCKSGSSESEIYQSESCQSESCKSESCQSENCQSGSCKGSNGSDSKFTSASVICMGDDNFLSDNETEKEKRIKTEKQRKKQSQREREEKKRRQKEKEEKRCIEKEKEINRFIEEEIENKKRIEKEGEENNKNIQCFLNKMLKRQNKCNNDYFYDQTDNYFLE
jgi:hypothetical protein